MTKPVVGVLLHVFYLELLPTLTRVLAHFPSDVVLLVSTRKKHLSEIEAQLKQAAPRAELHLQAVPNVGFDIAPMLICFAEQIQQLDVVCKLHTKNSNHYEAHSGWREHLIENLAGSREIVDSVLEQFECNEKLGVVLSGAYPTLKKSMQWNRAHLEAGKALMDKLRLPVESLVDFPAGSMFWFRPQVLQPLFSLDWSWQDFRCKGDEGLAHVIERTILLLAAQQGFTWRKKDNIAAPGSLQMGGEHRPRVAVVLHVWQLTGLMKAITAIKNIPNKFQLFVTFSGDDLEALSSVIQQHFDEGSFHIVRVENEGHDLAPFLRLGAQLKNYDLVCKLHLKQSSAAWLDYLLSNLVGGLIEIKVILAMFARNQKLGLVYPETFPDEIKRLSWGVNYERACQIADAAGLPGVDPAQETFLSSTMFWCRPAALDKLFDCSAYRFSSDENSLSDGAEAHAIERLILHCTASAGFTYREVLLHPNKQQIAVRKLAN